MAGGMEDAWMEMERNNGKDEEREGRWDEKKPVGG